MTTLVANKPVPLAGMAAEAYGDLLPTFNVEGKKEVFRNDEQA
jgi:hypothetical protein